MGADTFAEPHREKYRPAEQHGPAPIGGKHARHPSVPYLKRVLSWGQHTNKLILGGGAIATAIGRVSCWSGLLCPSTPARTPPISFLSARSQRNPSAITYIAPRRSTSSPLDGCSSALLHPAQLSPRQAPPVPVRRLRTSYAHRTCNKSKLFWRHAPRSTASQHRCGYVPTTSQVCWTEANRLWHQARGAPLTHSR